MDSEYRHICARCGRNSTEKGCWRDEDRFDNGGPCESIQCFVITATPVDVISTDMPWAIRKRVEHDVLILGSAFVEKTYVEKVVHGEKLKFTRWIHYPAEQMTIGQLNTWSKRNGFTKYPNQ